MSAPLCEQQSIGNLSQPLHPFIDDRSLGCVPRNILIRLTCDYLIPAAYLKIYGTVRGAEVENVFVIVFDWMCHVQSHN